MVGYRKNGNTYLSRKMPPVSFKYSDFRPQEQRYQSVKAKGNDLPPRGLGSSNFTLVDIHGDGMPDILETTANGYYYWRNLGEGTIDRRNQQTEQPGGVTLEDPTVAFGDMGGNGLADLIVQAPQTAGFYEATPDARWKPYKPFKTYPSFDLSDANTRLVDLTGDGLSDVLVTRDRQHFLWYQCLGEDGYGEPQATPRSSNLDEFPDVYFSDPRVRLADMSGDGLSDIVLIHDGRIDYWPNRGYGQFGKRITMTNMPRIGSGFDPKRMFLADLDGTGSSDLIFVDFTKVHFWFNQSGNSWSARQTIDGTPFVTDTTTLQFADVLGTGTATLVWSYDFGQTKGGNYKLLDFCGGRKPYLLTEMSNNMGATTRAQYAPSTKFYLEDNEKGQPWATNLPFPIQVLEKTEVIDHIGRTKLVTTYKYHHGYYDGREREFRGFGRVDQLDSEEFGLFSAAGLHGDDLEFVNKNKAFHVPTILTRTWFHTGVFFEADYHIDHRELTRKYRDEEYYNGDPQAFRLEDHEFESHEAYRALRGAILRSEVYALDGHRNEEEPGDPYKVTEHRHMVKQLQARTKSRTPTPNICMVCSSSRLVRQ